MRLLASALVAGMALGQAPPSFRSGVDLVEIAVIVRDANGSSITSLGREDFTITERGVPQRIAVFDRVSLPIERSAPGAAPAAAPDVSTNEGIAEARIYVLVLDALHVSPQRTQVVRTAAKRFIEHHVGPSDLVAVVSPGALDSATQDFTSSRAHLLAAIDQFTGSKLRSATLEIEEERRQAALSGILMHEGRDPGDTERADRAESLVRVLQALSVHLNRVEHRRKALLLFSEGIEYNVADALGVVQRNASGVVRSMTDAVGALMRSNVSVYAIDPRALTAAGADQLDRPIHRSSPYAPRPDGTAPQIGLAEPSLEAEYAASVTSLRQIAESTGGFAAVSGNDLAGAFSRIVRDSSEYYILAYAPSAPGRPGEFRDVSVSVSRPDASVVARKGYTVPRHERSGLIAADRAEPAVPGFGHRRAGARPFTGADAIVPTPQGATGGLADDLRALLASPLPKPGLPMRVQAIPFSRGEKRGAALLVVEVLGDTLRFDRRGDRFEETIELATMTVDAKAKGGNGRSTRIALRLDTEELQRVRATGVRWLEQFELAPGRYQVRVAGRATGTGIAGLVTCDVEIPRLDPQRPGISGIALTSLTSVIMITRGESALGALQTPPSAARRFVAGDRLVAAVELFVPGRELRVTAEVVWPDGSKTSPLVTTVHGSVHGRHEQVTFPIDTAALGPGAFVLRVAAAETEPSSLLVRELPFEIVTAAAPR